jgi:arylsulfate sulfotransferase
VSKTVGKMLLVAIVLMQVGLLSNCGSSSSTEMTPAVVSVSLSSPSTSAVVGQSVQLTATVTGSSNTSVTWSVNGVAGGNSSVGTINSTGMYTAPAVPPSPNTVSVQATSVADTTKTASLTFTISNPAPQLSSISPAAMGIPSNAAYVPATGTVVTLSGTGFAAQSVVTANSTPLATTFVSAGQLTATIPANLVASPGVLQLTVSTPAPGGGTTSSFSFTVLSVGQVSPTNNPQVAQYSITPPRDANVSIQFGPDTNYGLETWSQPTPAGGGAVSLLVAGMRAFTTYHMRAVVNFSDGTQYLDSDQTFTTGGLPGGPVQATVTLTNGLSPTPGVELVDALGGSHGQPIGYVLDLEGNVIWYYYPADFLDTVYPLKLQPNGHFLMNILQGTENGETGGTNVLREADLAGNTISEVSNLEIANRMVQAGFTVPFLFMHHDFVALPNGHVIVIANSFKYYTESGGLLVPNPPGVTTGTLVTGDVLVDLDENRNPVWVWSAYDHLDVNRAPTGLPDWTHSNAVIYSPDDGNLVLSMRNQSWIIKIDYQNGLGSGDVLWRLGPGGDFTLLGGGAIDWFYNQHYPLFVGPQSAGLFELSLFDNGDSRVVDANGDLCDSPGAIPCYSRPVVFLVNETSKTASVVWQDPLSVYGFCCGNTDLLSGSRMEFDVASISPVQPYHGIVYEVTYPAVPPQTVWQLDITDQLVYRAFRIPSLYPGVQW